MILYVERDLLEWLAGLEPGQDGYGNEGDRAEVGAHCARTDHTGLFTVRERSRTKQKHEAKKARSIVGILQTNCHLCWD
jgi:hypothetical protein